MEIAKSLKCVLVERRDALRPESLDSLPELAVLTSDSLASLEVARGEVSATARSTRRRS
jgi:hypothetical protein